MARLTAKQKFDFVVIPLMRGEGNRLMDDSFGSPGLKILNDYERDNGFEETPAGSWTNQAGLEYIPLGLISRDIIGYFLHRNYFGFC